MDNFKFTSELSAIDKEELITLYRAVGWERYTDNPDLLLPALKNSSYCIFCFDEKKLVGLARSISDGHFIHYLQDILVLPKYQGQGVGKMLMDNAMEHFSSVKAHVLIADTNPKLSKFYKEHGFLKLTDLSKTTINCFVSAP